MGVPLINAIYANDPLVGLYTLPLLIWHPMQLLVGSFLAPRLAKFVQREHERLGIVDQDEVGESSPAVSSPSPPSQSVENILEGDEEIGLHGIDHKNLSINTPRVDTNDHETDGLAHVSAHEVENA